MTSPVVRTERLTKDFPVGFWRQRSHRALNELSLEISAGGVFGLVGPNGAGKTTALKLLLALLLPTSGHAEIFGRPAGDLDARRRLGFLPEQPIFYDHVSGEELLNYFAGLFGLTGNDRRRRVSDVLDRVGIGADRRRPLRQYSKGMVQRIALAQALVNDPEFVMLDEPMAGLDPVGRRDVREIILELAGRGRTVLFSTHILADAELLCTRIGILVSGQLVVNAPLGELARLAKQRFEIVVADLRPAIADRIQSRVYRLTRIDEGRYSLELPEATRPEPLIAELASLGATLVSVNPVRTTLEDVVLRAIAAFPDRGSTRGRPSDVEANASVGSTRQGVHQ